MPSGRSRVLVDATCQESLCEVSSPLHLFTSTSVLLGFLHCTLFPYCFRSESFSVVTVSTFLIKHHIRVRRFMFLFVLSLIVFHTPSTRVRRPSLTFYGSAGESPTRNVD